MSEPITKPRRRRLALSLRTLMILVLIVGGFLGWQARRASLQRQAVAVITAAGGRVQYDYAVEARKKSGKWINDPPHPWAPDWLRRSVGPEYFQDVAWVFLNNKNPVEEIKHDPKLFETVALLDRVEMLQTIRYPLDNADFARLMAMPRLKEVTLLFVDVTDEGLACLESSPAIESLVLRAKPDTITVRGLERIARQPRINRLELTQVDLTDPADLAPLAKLTRLENLMLMNSPTDDACLNYLANLTELNKLDLRRTQVTDAGVDRLAKLPKLQVVLIDGSKLTEVGLAKLDAIGSLKGIYLDPLPQMTDRGLASLSKLQGFDTLCLTAPNVTDAGLARLKGLNLLRMTISGAGVTDAGVKNLAANNQTQELNLSGTSITSEGLPALSAQTRLRWLGLDGTTIDDAGAAILATLPELRFLSLDETPLTDAGLKSLQGAVKLEFLRVRGTQVTQEGLETFRKARPGVTIKSGPAVSIPSQK